MPLVTCVDCGKRHSDAAPACPECGRPYPAPSWALEQGSATNPTDAPPNDAPSPHDAGRGGDHNAGRNNPMARNGDTVDNGTTLHRATNGDTPGAAGTELGDPREGDTPQGLGSRKDPADNGVTSIWLWVGFLVVGAGAVALSQSGDRATTPTGRPAAATAVPTPPPEPEVPESIRIERAAAAEAQRLAAKWSYRSSTDQMTSKPTRFATIQSDNTIEFDFPYQDPQRATLTLRTHPRYGRDVLISVEKGQILCGSYDGCSIGVRFDDEAPTTWRASEPDDNSSTTLFIRGADRFVQRLRRAKTVRIVMTFYQEGSPTLTFSTGGFDYGKYTGTP